MKKEKQPLRLWLKFFRAVFAAISVSFFGDIVILISIGAISELIKNISNFLELLLLSGFVALILAGVPTLIAYFIIEFVPKQYRTICAGVYAVLLGICLEALFHNFKITGAWLLGSMIAVAMTELILREKNTATQQQTQETV